MRQLTRAELFLVSGGDTTITTVVVNPDPPNDPTEPGGDGGDNPGAGPVGVPGHP